MGLSMAGSGGLQCLIQVVVALMALSLSSSTLEDPTDCPDVCSCDVPAGVMDCSNSGISQVPSPVGSWVKVLRLDGNPLVCGCSTVRLYEALPQNTLQGAVCTNLNNTPVADVATHYPHLCTTPDITTYQDYNIQLYLPLSWDDDYYNSSSKIYKELSTRIQGELDDLFAESLPSNYSLIFTFFDDYRGPSRDFVTANLEMSCRLPPQTSVRRYRDTIYLLVQGAAATGGFSFGIHSIYTMVHADSCCGAPIPLYTDKGVIWFNSQLPGDTATPPCPENPDKNATFECIMSANGWAEWGSWNISQCQTPSDRTKGLEDLSQKPVTNESLAAITGELANLTQDITNFTHREVSLVADVMHNCVTAPNVPVQKEIAAELLVSVNKMLSVDSNTLVEAERNRNSSTRLVRSVEHLGDKMDGTTDGVKIAEPQIGILAAKPEKGEGLFLEITGDVEDNLTTGRISISTSGPNLTDLSGYTAVVHLPLSVVQQAEDENIHFAVYKSPTFFKASELAQLSTDVGPPDDTPLVIDSQVVAAKVGRMDLTRLNDSVTITLRHASSNPARHFCVFWDYSIAAWSHEGCHVTFFTDRTTTYECDHLTNFALIMNIYNTAGQLPDIHKKILSILSYIGCGVSAAGLILTLLTYFTFRKLLKDNPSKILVNLCSALLGIIVSFVFTSQWFVRDNVSACKFLAVLTHYFVLAAMAWMSVEALYMYIALVRVFHTGFSKFLLKCCLIGWGVPLVVVGITAGLSPDNYGVQGEICWLPQAPFLAAVMAPVALTLILNGAAFGLVIHRLHTMNKLKLQKSKCSSTQSQLLGAAGIMVLLGLTWIFAFFAIGQATVVFQYMFVVSNSLQGLFIFVFHCLRNRDARRAWMGCLRTAKPGRQTTSSSGGSSHQRQAASTHSATRSTEVSAGHSQR